MGQTYGARPSATARGTTPPEAGRAMAPAEIPYALPLNPYLYPALGYTDDGRPIYTPDQLGDPVSGVDAGATSGNRWAPGAGTPGASDGVGIADGDSGTDDRRESPWPSWRSLAVTSVIAVLVAAVAAIGWNLVRDDDPGDVITLPSDTELTQLPDTEPPGGGSNGIPGGGGAGIDTSGKEVVYEVTIDGSAVILYIEGGQVRTEMAPSDAWSATFTGGAYPLRLMVVAGTDTAATCSISVDGEVIVSDEVSADSPRRTAACRT